MEEGGTWHPDCGKCPFPTVLPANQEAVRLYMLVASGLPWELVMVAYKPRMKRQELQFLLEKLALIHNIVNEPREVNSGDRD